MTASPVDDELRALQVELTQVRARLADHAWGPDRGGSGPRSGGSYAGALLLVVVLGAPALVLLLLTALAVGTGEPAVAVVFGLLLALLAGPLVWAVRRAVRAVRPATAARQELLQAERRIVARIGQLYEQRGGAPAPDAAGDLPLPPHLQPSAYAQTMSARFGGTAPEQALRRLPADAPAWQVLFHRRLGWGLLLGLGLVVLGIGVRVFLR